jgi:hypothetical protein
MVISRVVRIADCSRWVTHEHGTKRVCPHAQLLALLKHIRQVSRTHSATTDLQLEQLDLPLQARYPAHLSRSERVCLRSQIRPAFVVPWFGGEDMVLLTELAETWLEAGLDSLSQYD